MPCAYSYFYGDSEVIAEIEDIEKCLLEGGIDPDGISQSEWIKALKDDDLLFLMMQHVIRNKNDPSMLPLYDLLRDHIGGILDKE